MAKGERTSMLDVNALTTVEIGAELTPLDGFDSRNPILRLKLHNKNYKYIYTNFKRRKHLGQNG